MLRRELALAAGLMALAIGVACSSSDGPTSVVVIGRKRGEQRDRDRQGVSSMPGLRTHRHRARRRTSTRSTRALPRSAMRSSSSASGLVTSRARSAVRASRPSPASRNAHAPICSASRRAARSPPRARSASKPSPRARKPARSPRASRRRRARAARARAGSGSPGPHTCAQLVTCCAKITDPDEQTQCNKIAQGDAGSDTACDIAYSSFSAQATGGCP